MDQLYPNEGSYFQPTEPEDQKTERKRAESKSLAAVPKLKEIIAAFDEDIALLNSVSSIHVDPDTDPKGFMREWHVNQEKLRYAENKKEWLLSMIPENLR